MALRFFIFIFICLQTFAFSKPPTLTPKDAKNKIHEILKAHVSYQYLSTELVRRSYQNYLEELDPLKTYLIESEVLTWTSPSEELLQKTLQDIQNENFETYSSIYELMLTAIERRNAIEQELQSAELPKGVKPEEFKDIGWAKNEEELKDRLLRIKALQLETAEKLNQESKNQFIQRLNKRRLNREEELKLGNKDEKGRLVLSYTLKAISGSLDSQTAYFTPSEANQFMIQVQQKLYGIGAQLRDDLNGLTIVRLLDGGPASASNQVKAGDKIIAVNHEPVVGMDITEAVELIRGQQGTTVNLTILREVGDKETKTEEKLNIEIVRGEVVLKETRLETSYEPFGDGVIGILHLFSFYQDNKTSSTQDLAKAIEELKKTQNLKGIILDLRSNAGGLLPQAVSVTGLFISKGVVVSVKDNSGEIQRLRNLDTKKAWDGPLVVLTNKTSASAAEIVAQTLQDYGRAVVVGDEVTFGKGTFQTFTLESAHYGKVNPKGEYKVTRGRYYTVSGKSPQLVGVRADIVIPGIFSQMEIGEKYSKFPLENDQIPPCFNDDLSDVSPLHRNQIMRLYKFNLQPVLTTYQPFIEILKLNSSKRIEENKNYQNFLKEIAKKEYYDETSEQFGQNDLQQEEAINIMKDLIFLSSAKMPLAVGE